MMKIELRCTSVTVSLSPTGKGLKYVARFSVVAGDGDDGLTLRSSSLDVVTKENVYEVGVEYDLMIS